MRLPGFLGARSRLLALWSLALGLLPGQALAQPSKDNTSPPIDVPTTPVPQGPAAPPPAAPPPAKPAPKPAPAAPAAPAAPKSGEDEDKKDLKFNNEGVFKISGSKGAGTVGGKKAAPGAATSGAPAKGKAKGGAATSAANIAQWPGFRMTEDGGSEVMVEFSKATGAPTEHKAAGSLTYVFKGVQVSKTNNKNPLITVHFNTPVASARLVSKKGELHLIIDYRAGADAAATTGLRPGSDGAGQQFFVKFPAGSWLPKGAEEIGPAPTQKLKAKGKGDKSSEEKPAAPAPAPKPESGSKTGPTP